MFSMPSSDCVSRRPAGCCEQDLELQGDACTRFNIIMALQEGACNVASSLRGGSPAGFALDGARHSTNGLLYL